MENDSNLPGILFTSDTIHSVMPGIIISITLFLIFLCISALLSGAEIAFFNLFQTYRNIPDTQRTKKQNRLFKLIDNPDQQRIALWISGIFFKTATFVAAVAALFQFLANHIFHVWLVIGVLALLILVFLLFSELLPKAYASAKPEKFAFRTRGILSVILWFFKPLTLLFISIMQWINKKLSINPRALFANEISSAMEQAHDVFTDDELILKGIVKFGNIDVSEILKPRVDVVAIDFRSQLSDVLAVVVESGYSRIPVYDGNFDNIKGILYVKDLLPHIDKSNNFKWQTLIRPSYFVPDSKKVKELLTEFQANKIHMSVIVDEYGGTLGIVTLEDIIEEIVGEISDESDEDEKFYTQLNENTFIFDGKVLLNDFHKIVQTNPEIFSDIKGDADTLAGLILELRGEIPSKNEEIKFKQFIFKIEAADLRRIKQIRVTINNDEE